MFAVADPWRCVSHSDPWLLRWHFKTPERSGEKFSENNCQYGEKEKEYPCREEIGVRKVAVTKENQKKL
jgi:hypothetical protein